MFCSVVFLQRGDPPPPGPMDIDNPSLKEAMERKEDLPGDEKKKDYHVGLPVRNLDHSQLITQVSAHNVLFSCFSFG